MAETDSNLQQPLLAESEEEKRLKYLEFVQVATLHTLMYAAKLYTYAKENSGPLKPGVDTVEGTVKTVVGPVYDKYHGVPNELLKLVDRKVFIFFLYYLRACFLIRLLHLLETFRYCYA
jgi:hypothetical protein